MTTYFDYRRIDELLEDNCNCYRQQKEFTLDELSQYDGKNGKPAYVAIEGIIYDASNESVFMEAKNIEIIAGKDLTEQFNSYCRMNQIINEAPKIGVLDNNNDIEREINMVGYEPAKQNTSKFSHDYLSNYVEPLVKYVRSDRNKHGTKKSSKCQECIMSDALLGVEKILQESIKQVLEWQTQLLKCPGPTTSTGAATGGVGTTESTGATSSGVGGVTGIAGGAAGGAGGGLGVAIKSNEILGGVETTSEEEKKLGPGATGGATGGALGGSSIAPTGRRVGGLEGTTEITDDMGRRDRLYFD